MKPMPPCLQSPEDQGGDTPPEGTGNDFDGSTIEEGPQLKTIFTIKNFLRVNLAFHSSPLNSSFTFDNTTNISYHPLTGNRGFHDNVRMALADTLELDAEKIGVTGCTLDSRHENRRLRSSQDDFTEADGEIADSAMHQDSPRWLQALPVYTVFKVQYELETTSEEEVLHIRFQLLGPTQRAQFEKKFPRKLQAMEQVSGRDVAVHAVIVGDIHLEEYIETTTTTTTTVTTTTVTSTTTSTETTTSIAAPPQKGVASFAMRKSMDQVWWSLLCSV